MNILILHAHYESKSFCSALKDLAVEHFTEQGHIVKVKDLYAMNFNPVPSRNDFKTPANAEYFSYLKEEMNAFMTKGFSDEIKQEMDDLLWADMLVLNFPLWWSSVPAILKGWFDKVLALGFAYHPRDKKYQTGPLKGKKAFCCISAGGSEASYTAEGENGDLAGVIHHINHGTLNYCGINVYPPFVTWRTHLLPEEPLKQYLYDYKNYLNNLDKSEILY